MSDSNGEINLNDAAKDNAIKEDPNSPSGYSIYKLNQWIPLVIQGKKKKKKKKSSEEISGGKKEKGAKLSEIDLEKLKVEWEKLQEYIAKHLFVIESGLGYALVVKPTALNIQTYLEYGAGFQPYEAVNAKTYMIVYLICFGRMMPDYGPMALSFISNTTNKENDVIHVYSEIQIDAFINKDKPK